MHPDKQRPQVMGVFYFRKSCAKGQPLAVEAAIFDLDATRIAIVRFLSFLAMTIAQLFNGANLFVLPFWALMILLPNWDITRKVMASYIPYVILASLYVFLFVTSITPESAQAFSNPQLADIARFLADDKAAATGWVHFLVMDLFVGRWIYLEGQRTGIWTIHSLALCLFAGPLGLLSHIITQWVTNRFFSGATPDSATPSTPTSQV